MQTTALSFRVTSARLTPSERFIDVAYTESGSDTPLVARVGTKGFEHYLKSMHDIDCPSLVEWMCAATRAELHTRIASFMECMKWEEIEQRSGANYEYAAPL